MNKLEYRKANRRIKFLTKKIVNKKPLTLIELEESILLQKAVVKYEKINFKN